MELFTVEFLTSLISIIFIDLVLAGDNALLIGLVAKNLSHHQQKKVIVWGTICAIFVRILLTLVAVRLLEIDGLMLVGGVLLVFISYKLLLSENDLHIKSSKKTFWGAIGTIVLADFLMGIDNIIAVAGAAHGSFILVVIGLFISIPIVIWGSTLVIRLLDKFPIILIIGSGILAWTASKMIAKDSYTQKLFTSQSANYKFEALVVIFVLLIGLIVKYRNQKNK